MGPSAFTVGIDGPILSPDERRFLGDARPWGVILFARNIETPNQLGALTDDLRTILGDDLPILVDQEGGRVQRLFAPHWRQWLPPLDHAAKAGEQAARAMYLRALLIGHELSQVGIDVNCAPTCDVATENTHPFLLNRCYGRDAATVTALARATADGLMDAGVLPVMKHIPGHGRGQVDSHLALPRTNASQATLRAADFEPFRALANLPMAMTAHMVFSALDNRPATQSPVMIDAIRTDMGFDGLLMSDDISMEALGGTVAERAQSALDAGCDLILHCNGDLPERRTLAEALPVMTLMAETRARAALAARRTALAIDISAVEAELSALMGGTVYG